MAWLSLREACKTMPMLYIGVFLLFELAKISPDVTIAYRDEAVALFPRYFGSSLSFFTLFFVSQILSMACIAVVAVATHRFILLGDGRPKVGRVTLHFFFWIMIVNIVFDLPEVAAFLGHGAMPDSGFLTEIYYVVLVLEVIIAIYSAAIFPSVAVEEKSLGFKDRIAMSWNRMDGNCWLFVRASILACLPIILAGLLVLVPLGLIPFLRISDWTLWRLIDLTRSIVGDLLAFPVWMVQVAVASWLYSWVRQQPRTFEPAANVMPG
jgi:hypothetical protein